MIDRRLLQSAVSRSTRRAASSATTPSTWRATSTSASRRLGRARRYADDVAALPFFREERHIGLGRRIEVDAIAGTSTRSCRAELFERDWRRAGRPVAGNLAVGAYAAAMTFGMLADDARRARWIEITEPSSAATGGLRTTPRTSGRRPRRHARTALRRSRDGHCPAA